MITAIVLAAGPSKRMGQPKMLLPWGEKTVLATVLSTIRKADIPSLVVVTGARRIEVEKICASYEAIVVHNPDYDNDDMLVSLQMGLQTARDKTPAESALICLGDQPQVEEGCVRAVASRFIETGSNLVVPSYQMRRGHPWLAARPLWEEILQMRPPQTPRDFLNRHADDIAYVEVDTPSVLADIDTFEEYLKFIKTR